MRRMYSQNELETLVKDVFLADVESGEIDFAGIMADALENMDVVAKSLSADSIIEIMEGYSFSAGSPAGHTFAINYAGVVKNGNKITFVMAFELTKNDAAASNTITLGNFTIPSSIGEKLYPNFNQYLDQQSIALFESATGIKSNQGWVVKVSNTEISFKAYVSNMTVSTRYAGRYETTFLLSENLAS